ncbi:HutD/Ves family protein [Paraburkholderia fynbosensis]|uniref:Protein Ves n=1 Tax=Paraburkholderia fynbosensis TaxID=1200993 RepID=A0A6J5FI04_9BURK|nr:HutD family protein [Paraburkholderia fynbosensis]CAB3778013.1 Protein Ves [Paraburkholderia fynbosensis]
MATLTLIRGAGLVAAPWKNGGGVTREVAVFPERAGMNDFMWRVSIADVARAGPFSRFEGIDRTLVLLSGAGMVLDETGARAAKSHALTRALDIARFDGAAQIDARLVDGATRDFNLMVRRDAARGELDVWHGQSQARTQHSLSADVALLYCASGQVALAAGDAEALSLDTGDTLRIDMQDPSNALSCTLEGAGAVLAISIRYTQR